MTAVLSLIGLNIIFYFRTIFYDLVIDDMCRNFHKKDLQKNIFVRLFRVTRYSGYGGIPLRLDHFINIVLHTLTCISIYLVFGRNEISFFTAVIFSIHPVTNQVSIWLNGKRYAVTSNLMLWMWYLQVVGLPLYFIGFIWHFGVLPGIFLFARTNPLIIWALPIMVLLGIKQIINRIGSRWERIPFGEIKQIRPRKAILAVKIFGYVTLHCLLPRRMAFYHLFMERYGFSEEDNKECYALNADFWRGVATILAVSIVMVMNWDNNIGFGLFWYCLFISPWLSFPIGFTQTIAERVVYLPLVGLVYALISTIMGLSSIYHIPIIFALMGYYGAKMWSYMPAYRNLEEFYRFSLFEFPNHFRARAHVIQKYLQEQRVFYALKEAGEGLKLMPKDFTLNLLMAQSLMAIGAWSQAKEYLERADKLKIPGQEKYLQITINQHMTIIDDRLKGLPLPPQIRPDEKVDVELAE